MCLFLVLRFARALLLTFHFGARTMLGCDEKSGFFFSSSCASFFSGDHFVLTMGMQVVRCGTNVNAPLGTQTVTSCSADNGTAPATPTTY